MSEEITNGLVNKVSEEVRDKLLRASASALPNNPTACGWKPEDIRRALYQAVLGESLSILNELDRIVDEINGSTKTHNESDTAHSDIRKKIGSLIDFSMDSDSYRLHIKLKHENGDVLSEGTVDLPLESMILGARYEDGYLYLKVKTADGALNNEEIKVSITDLIKGLVSESVFNTHLDSDTAHKDIRDSIEALRNLISNIEVGEGIDLSALVVDLVKKSTLENEVKALEKKIGTDISTHNTSGTAHSDIRNKIGTDILSHNTSGLAHADIRKVISDNYSALEKMIQDAPKLKYYEDNTEDFVKTSPEGVLPYAVLSEIHGKSVLGYHIDYPCVLVNTVIRLSNAFSGITESRKLAEREYIKITDNIWLKAYGSPKATLLADNAISFTASTATVIVCEAKNGTAANKWSAMQNEVTIKLTLPPISAQQLAEMKGIVFYINGTTTEIAKFTDIGLRFFKNENCYVSLSPFEDNEIYINFHFEDGNNMFKVFSSARAEYFEYPGVSKSMGHGYLFSIVLSKGDTMYIKNLEFLDGYYFEAYQKLLSVFPVGISTEYEALSIPTESVISTESFKIGNNLTLGTALGCGYGEWTNYIDVLSRTLVVRSAMKTSNEDEDALLLVLHACNGITVYALNEPEIIDISELLEESALWRVPATFTVRTSKDYPTKTNIIYQLER